MPASFCVSSGLWPWPLLSVVWRITRTWLRFIIHFGKNRCLASCSPSTMGWLLPPGRVTLPSIISLTHTKHMHQEMHTHTRIGIAASVHDRMQICKHMHKRMRAHISTQVLTNIFLRLAHGHIFLATKVIPTDKHILITWASVA